MTVDVCSLPSLHRVLVAVLAMPGAASVLAGPPQRGCILGANGTILHTAAGAFPWTAQNTGVTDPLGDLAAIDSPRASVAGGRGRVRKSTAGGATRMAVNTNGSSADVSLVISRLGTGVPLVTRAPATGTTAACRGAAGRKFHTGTGVAPGASATVTFEFNATNAAAVTFTAAGPVGAGSR